MKTKDVSFNVQKGSLGARSGHLLMTLTKDLSRFFTYFLWSPRTERALRVALFFIPPLLLFYNNWFDLNFSHAGPLLYLIMSSLIPPLISSVSLIAFLINAAQFLSMAWVTLMYVIAVSSSTIAGKTAVFLVFLVHVILLSPCKVGKMSPLLNTVSTLGVYICVLGFFNSYPILFGDLTVHIFWPYLHKVASSSPQIVQLVLRQFPADLQELLSKLLHSEPNNISFFKPVPITLTVPPLVTSLNDQLDYFVGEEVKLVVHHKGIDAKLVPGLWFVRLAWGGTSKLGIIRHLYILSGFAMGCFILSLLMPPQRYIRSYMRRLLGKCFRTCSKAARNCLYSYIAKNEPEINVTPSYSIAEMYLEDMNEFELKPSMRKFSNRLIMNWNKKKTKKLMSIASVRDYESISLIPVVIKVLSMDAMILQSFFEPSLHNPGPGLWSSPYWKPLTLSLQSFLFHTINLQHLIVQDSQDTYYEAYNNMMETSHIPPKAFSSRANADEVREWIWNSSNFPILVNSALKVYRLCEILVSMKPASRGSQHDVFRQFLFLLSCHQKQHELLREDTQKFCFHAMTANVTWQEKVLLFGAQWEAERLILELPSHMANTVDTISTASTKNIRFVHVFYNLFAFVSPFFIFFKLYISSLLFLVIPWRWRWRMVYPWVFTRLPWYRDPKVAYCLRWIFGIALLFALPLYCEDYRLWTITESTQVTPEKINIVSLTTKVASWSILGFLASIQMTVEGTMYRSILRFLGMLLGSLSGYLCITIVGLDRKVPQILWLIITTFCVCWIGCNSENPFLGYNTSWGYACQFFIYQQAIIVFESYLGTQTVKELFLSRVVSQLFGISTAYLISCFVFPCQCHLLMTHAARQILFSANHLVHLQLLNTHIISQEDDDEDGDKFKKKKSYKNQTKQEFKSSDTVHRSLRSSIPKSQLSPKTISAKDRTSFSDSKSHFPFLSSFSHNKKGMSSEEFVKEFEHYMNLMNEGVGELKLLSRELGNLESAALRKVNTNVYDGITILKLIAIRQSMLMSYFHYPLKIESEGFYFQLFQLLEEIDKLLLYTEQLLTGTCGFSWFIGYRHLFWHIIPFINTAPQLTVEWIPLEFLIHNVLKKWNGLDIYFAVENKTEPFDRNKSNPSQNLLLQYQMTYFVWAYILDVFKYVSVLTQL